MAILKSALAVLILASLLCGVLGCWSSKPEMPQTVEMHHANTTLAPSAPEPKTEPESNWGEGTKWNLEHPSN